MHKTFWLMGVLVLAACGSATLDGDSGISADEGGVGFSGEGEGLEGGSISEVEFDGNNQAVISFDDVGEDERYVLALYSYNASGNTEAYQLGNSKSLNRELSALTLDRTEKLTEDFHETLREEESFLNPDESVKTSQPRAAKLAQSVGDTRKFKVLNSFGGAGTYETVTAVLIYKGNNFLAWVDKRNQDSYTSDEWNSVLATFDSQIASERTMFGTESDVDGDGRFNCLFTQVVNELGGSSGGIVTGFFYAVDLFTNYKQSNQTEVINAFVADPSGEFGTAISKEFAKSNIHPSVLLHEFQHMINFNMHYFVNAGSPEMSFLNEALSHQAEDLHSLDGSGYMTATGPENPARVAGYLDSIDDLCIICGASLYQRGGSYLLIRYLYEQAEKGNLAGASSGADLIDRLLDTDKTGVENIVSAVYGEGTSEERFGNLMGQFGLAVFLSDTGLSDDSRFQIDGIGLRSAQDDNRGTVLDGPAVNSASGGITSTIGGASLSFVELTSD
ncbi:MAG: hypothetical protein Q7T11_06335, partial [Deltaproteobacteria bacterium]|nr:hypothetical protein [Deltaproteobacteria bacterium]